MNQSIVVLFMKGTKSEPADGYQKMAVEYLEKIKLRYTSYDVIVESDVRELLKEHSRWNSFPQLFVNGKFVGGLNFIMDNIKSGKISNYIPTTEIMLPLREKIIRIINKGVFMVFMRGRPTYPSCPKSKQLMDLFRQHYPWFFDTPKDSDLQL